MTQHKDYQTEEKTTEVKGESLRLMELQEGGGVVEVDDIVHSLLGLRAGNQFVVLN